MYRSFPVFIWVALSCAVALTACDNTISPLAEDADRIVAIHGFLNSVADTQFVRVSALQPTVLSESPGLDGISVHSFESETAEVVTDWTRVPGEENGKAGSLFAGVFMPETGKTYTLQIMREDREIARAFTTLPSDLVAMPEIPTGDTLSYSQSVVIGGIVKRPLDLKMKYEVRVPESQIADTVYVTYSQDGTRTTQGWLFHVFLKQDQIAVSRQLGTFGTSVVLGLRKVGLEVTVQSREYDDPDRPSNLTNAHGFFGSLSRLELSWMLDTTSVSIIGFNDEQSLE